MGWVRKQTGVQAQIDAANKNAEAQEQATTQAAEAQAMALQDSARAAAEAQTLQAARLAAETKAADVAAIPMGEADVQLQVDAPNSAAAARRKRRTAFGQNYSGGVQI